MRPDGSVHHSNYIRYFECARNEMMDAWGYTVEQCQADGITFPMASAELRFHRPALAGDFLTVTAEMDKLPLAKLVVKQQVFNQKGELCCDGVVTLGFLRQKQAVPHAAQKGCLPLCRPPRRNNAQYKQSYRRIRQLHPAGCDFFHISAGEK